MSFDVAIVLAPPASNPAWQEAVVASCEAAIGPGRCGPDAADGSTAWAAVVSLGEPSSVEATIRFYAGSSGGVLLETRALRFGKSDPVRLRCASLGLVIASFVV